MFINFITNNNLSKDILRVLNKSLKLKATNGNWLKRIFKGLLILIFLPYLVMIIAYKYRLIYISKNHIFKIKNTLFYLPNKSSDHIQRNLIFDKDFYESNILSMVENRYFKDNFFILDIGANIGNHSLFYAKSKLVRKVYSFEPIKDIYRILKVNVVINKLEEKIETFNLGLSNEEGKASISNYDKTNLGSTSIVSNNKGNIIISKLDNIQNSFNKIDFIKIDVEGHEDKVLLGMKQIFIRFNPIIQIEIFSENYDKVIKIFNEINYKVDHVIDSRNYIFISRWYRE